MLQSSQLTPNQSCLDKNFELINRNTKHPYNHELLDCYTVFTPKLKVHMHRNFDIFLIV